MGLLTYVVTDLCTLKVPRLPLKGMIKKGLHFFLFFFSFPKTKQKISFI